MDKIRHPLFYTELSILLAMFDQSVGSIQLSIDECRLFSYILILTTQVLMYLTNKCALVLICSINQVLDATLSNGQ